MYSVAEAAKSLTGPAEARTSMDAARSTQAPRRIGLAQGQDGAALSGAEKARDQASRPEGLQEMAGDDRQALVDQIQQALEEMQHKSLQFSVDESTGRTVIKVVDKDTGEVIKEIPPEETLRLAEKIEEMSGILFDKRA